MIRRSTSALCAGLFACVAGSAAAAPAAGQTNLQVVPKIGLFMPLSAIADHAELEMGVAFGVAGELVLPGLPVNLRANLDYAHTTDIIERSAAERRLGEGTILSVTGNVVVRPLAADAAAQPYFLGGAGVKTYDLRFGEPGAGELRRLEGTSSRFTAVLGGGVDVRFGPVALVLEITDYISTFEATEGVARLQHDLFGMLGFRVSMF
jgi:hypothetical protein